MQQVIYKYHLPLRDTFSLKLPKGARILHFGNQYETPTLWVLIDRYTLNDEEEEHLFILIGTGHPLPRTTVNLRYIGTTLMAGGNLIWHLFEIVKE